MVCSKRWDEPLEPVQQSHLSPHRAGKESKRDLADDAKERPYGRCRAAEVAAGVIDAKEEPVELRGTRTAIVARLPTAVAV